MDVPEESIPPVLEFPVRLGVEAGEVFVSIENLLDLTSGSILELPLPEGDKVVLVLGETPVASARILSADGKYFLEISEIFSGEETSPGVRR